MAGETQQGKTAFVFDLDGTLVDSVAGIGSALAEAFSSLGRTMPGGFLREVIGPPIRVIAKRLEPQLSDAETAAIEAAYRPLYDNAGWRGTELFAGVQATLRILHQDGHLLFVATNKPRVPTLKILAHLRLGELIEDVVTRDSSQPPYAGKSAMLAALLGRHGLRDCVMVGDTEEDGEAARNNGLRFAFVTYGYGQAAHADYRLDDFAGVLQIARPAAVLAGMGGGR